MFWNILRMKSAKYIVQLSANELEVFRPDW